MTRLDWLDMMGGEGGLVGHDGEDRLDMKRRGLIGKADGGSDGTGREGEVIGHDEMGLVGQADGD